MGWQKVIKDKRINFFPLAKETCHHPNLLGWKHGTNIMEDRKRLVLPPFFSSGQLATPEGKNIRLDHIHSMQHNFKTVT